MHVHQLHADECIYDAIEDYVHTMTVRKIWIITDEKEDIDAIKEGLEERDYTVSGPHADGFVAGYQNTLLTDWDSYAADQASYLSILPALDMIVLDGITELNLCSWKKWAEVAASSGWCLKDSIIVMTT